MKIPCQIWTSFPQSVNVFLPPRRTCSLQVVWRNSKNPTSQLFAKIAI